jgi:hypothetical protein
VVGIDPAEGAGDMRAGCISARCDAEDPAVPANEATGAQRPEARQ